MDFSSAPYHVNVQQLVLASEKSRDALSLHNCAKMYQRKKKIARREAQNTITYMNSSEKCTSIDCTIIGISRDFVNKMVETVFDRQNNLLYPKQ